VSKKYKGKTCVYCGTASSTTADHVVAREFFLETRRNDLPKAPACERCNAEKSRLEHYLTTILPFAGRHADAFVNLETMVPKRLQKNAKLRSELVAGLAEIHDAGGLEEYATSLPLDYIQLERLFALIAKGLAWHHWKVILKPGYSVMAAFFMDRGAKLIEHTFAQFKESNRISVSLGEGTFFYEALQDSNDPHLSFWRFSIYGGASFGGDPSLPGERASQIVAVTGSDADPLIRRLRETVFGQNVLCSP